MSLGNTDGLTWDAQLMLWLCPLHASDFKLTSAAQLAAPAPAPAWASGHATGDPKPLEGSTGSLSDWSFGAKPEEPESETFEPWPQVPVWLIPESAPKAPVKHSMDWVNVPRGTSNELKTRKPAPIAVRVGAVKLPKGRRRDAPGQAGLMGLEVSESESHRDPEADAKNAAR